MVTGLASSAPTGPELMGHGRTSPAPALLVPMLVRFRFSRSRSFLIMHDSYTVVVSK